MPFSPAALIVWLIIGMIAGWLSGTLVTGFGRWTNFGVGLVGAIIGGLMFSLFGIWPGLDAISVSLRDIVAAFIGSLIFLLLVWIFGRSKTGSS